MINKRTHFHTSKVMSHPDWPFLIALFVLLALGLFLIYDASAVKAFYDFGDGFRFLKYQTIWVILGLIIFLVFQKIDYHYWQRVALPIMAATIVALLMVLLPGLGVEVNGAHRWLNVPFFNPQPSEFAKLTVLIYLSAWLTNKGAVKQANYFQKVLLPFFTMIGIVMFLIIMEPDMGTMLVLLGSSVLVYFVSGVPMGQLLLPVPVLGVIGSAMILLSPYRRARLLTFLDPTKDPDKAYHINQVLIALGSGGFFGLGLGNSRQKYQYIPEVYADSIFAVVGEEFGFLGAIALLSIYGFLIWRGFKIVQSAPDRFGKLLGSGVVFWLAIQIVLNIAAMTGMVPLTGIPLPFLSYGGSALLSLMMGIGILTNISKQGIRK